MSDSCSEGLVSPMVLIQLCSNGVCGYVCLVIPSKAAAYAFLGEAQGAGVLLVLVPEVLQILGSI